MSGAVGPVEGSNDPIGDADAHDVPTDAERRAQRREQQLDELTPDERARVSRRGPWQRGRR